MPTPPPTTWATYPRSTRSAHSHDETPTDMRAGVVEPRALRHGGHAGRILIPWGCIPALLG